MRVFAIKGDGTFLQYQPQELKIDHSEKVIETWLENNPECILEDGDLLIIGRQVTTNLASSADLLAVDRAGNATVIELKRGKMPRETLAQALEYASFAADLSFDQLQGIYRTYTGDDNASLVDAHRDYFSLDESEAVSFNKDQRIVIAASEITPPVRQTSLFMREKGIRVTCVEFGYFQTDSNEELLTVDIAVGREPDRTARPTSKALPKTDKASFLKSCDEAGRSYSSRC